jgi:hypothetical protein
MPTRSNIEEFDGLLNAVSALVDMKRQVDRVSQEVRLLRAQKEGYIPPPANPRKVRGHRQEQGSKSGSVGISDLDGYLDHKAKMRVV